MQAGMFVLALVTSSNIIFSYTSVLLALRNIILVEAPRRVTVPTHDSGHVINLARSVERAVSGENSKSERRRRESEEVRIRPSCSIPSALPQGSSVDAWFGSGQA